METRLATLGLTTAAQKVEATKDRQRKLTLAYEHFRFVRPEKLQQFNKRLKQQTVQRSGKEGRDLVERYDRLQFTKLGDYAEVPPTPVLDRLEAAIQIGCFDTFEVCTVESVVEYKDPIIFGRVTGCPDRFFVAQWDDDVKIEDILQAHEG